MITMLLYVLFSHAASHFPIHTLRLLHSLALASQVTLCTPFASVFSGFSTNTVFSVSFVFSRRSRHVSRNARGQGHAGLFYETIHLKRTDDTLMYPTMPRLSRHCLRFGRYLRPFVHDATYMTGYGFSCDATMVIGDRSFQLFTIVKIVWKVQLGDFEYNR